MLLLPILSIAFIGFEYNSIRGFLTYVIFFSTLHVFYIAFKKHFDILKKLIFIFNVLWLLSGLLQVVFGAEILSFLVTVRTGTSRGVTGLAPEPTHYAFYLLFISWLLLITNQKPSKPIIGLVLVNIAFILFVAKSSMVFFYCILFGVYILISYSSPKQIIKVIPLILIFPYAFYIYLNSGTSNRITNLVSNVIENPLLVIQNDESVNARFSAVVISIYGSITDFFIPHGFNSYINDTIIINEKLGNFFWWGFAIDKIMSGTGSLLYELGWFGIVIICLSYYIMCGDNKAYSKAFIPFLLLWTFLMGAIPMSFSLIPAVISAYYFINSRDVNDYA